MRRGQRVTFEAGGARLVGESWGEGNPAVVFLHAGACDRRSWDDIIARLPNAGTLVAYDMRGFGESPPAQGAFSHLHDLLAVLEQVADGPAWLVGSSLGGGLALDCALTEPPRVASMVLLAPAVSGAPEPELDPDTRHLDELINRASALGDLDEINRLETWLWLDGPQAPEGRVGGEARRLARAMNPTWLRNGVPEPAGLTPQCDAWNRLEEVAVPTTVGCGDRDVPYLSGPRHKFVRGQGLIS